jgi:uncharacterized membrane protein
VSDPEQRTAPGSALCLASGILTLLTPLVPPISFAFGIFALLNAWRASRAARYRPERFRRSAIPLATVVLVIIGWAFAGFIALLMTASADEATYHEAPTAERW